MAIVSYLQLNHPALGTAGGPALHASIEAIYSKIGDNIADRLLVAVNLNNGATATLEHNFNTAFSDLRWDLYLYDEVTTALTRVTDTSSPSLADFTVAATGADLTGSIDVTNNSGAQRDLALVVFRDPIYLREGDVKDVDVDTTPPEDGQALVYDAANSKWVPGASGDASFKIQSVTDPSAVLKGGFLQLDDGRELATYDGTGGASTDYGKDLTVNLDTILGSNPANATTYFLYIDLNLVPVAVTLTDNGRQVIGVQQGHLVLSAVPPASINRGRFVPLGFLRSATSGTVWSGAGSAFGTLAFRKHDNGPLALSPTVYRLAKQAVGSVGSSGQIAAGHLLSAKSFPSALSAANRSWFALAADGADGSGNARTLTANGSPAFTGTNILGSTNAAANLDGVDDNFSSANAFFNPGNGVSFAVGGWFALNDWTPAAIPDLISQWAGGSDRGFDIAVLTDGQIVFQATNSASVTDVSMQVPNPGFVNGSWHHIAMAFDFAAQTLRAYVDGKLVASAPCLNVRAVTSPIFRVGAFGTAAASFMAGKVEDVFFVQGALTAEDIRRLYARRLDHNTNVVAEKQRWSASLFTSCADESLGWLVCKGDPDSVFVDFSDLASTDSAEVMLENTALTAAVVPAGVGFDQTYSADPSFPLSHGQPDVPELEGMGETATGEWEPLSLTGHVRATATQVLGSLAAFFTGGHLRVRLKARSGQSPTGVLAASPGSPGIVQSYAPNPKLATLVLTNAGYTVLDGDGYERFLFSTGASDRTLTLPTAADNAGRRIMAKKTDSGAGKVILDGEGGELIDGATTFEIATQYAFVWLDCDGTGWAITG